jgi:hypothetical protein
MSLDVHDYDKRLVSEMKQFHTEQQLRKHIDSEAKKKKNLVKMFHYLCQ